MQIYENTFGKPQAVDRESMIIRGVKILGRVSQNGREYSDAALGKLRKFYENIAVNVDHDRKPGTERTMAAGFGVMRNVKLAADGVIGDIHYLANHPLADVILERAERMPESFGMSHNAEGRVVRRGEKLIVEDVAKVHSVDIVREPATTKGLFESQGEYDMRVMSIREIVETVPKSTMGLALLREQMDAGVIAADAPVEVPAEAEAVDQVKAAFRAAVIEAFDDDSLDTAATIARIKEILKAQEKMAPKPKKETPVEEAPPKEEATEAATESIQRAETAEAKCLLLEAGCKGTPEQVRAIAHANEADRAALVESWIPTTTARPASSPAKYTDSGTVDIPDDPKKFAAQLR